MGLKSFKELFSSKPQKKAPPKKNHLSVVEAKDKDEKSSSHDNAKTKAEIEQFKKQIARKLDDPSMQKKAAMIISNMINQKK